MATTGLSQVFAIANLGMHLLAAHDERITVAKEENSGVTQSLSVLDGDLATIFKAANAGEITAAEAALACMDVRNWYWQYIGPMQQGATKGPRSPFPNPGSPSTLSSYGAAGLFYQYPLLGGGCECDGKLCTAGCCIGCAAIDPCLSIAYKGFLTGKAFSVVRPQIVGNKYGLVSSAPYTISFTPPKVIVQAEMTISKVTGVVSVGAPPSSSDVVITTGKANSNVAPDTGGVQPISSLNETLTGASQAGAAGVEPSSSSSLLASLGPNALYYIMGAGLLVLLLLMRNAAPKGAA